MLQPRLARREGREDCNICVSEPRTSVHQCPCHDSRKTMALALIVVLAVIGAPLGATQTAGDSFIVRPTPALRPAVADELTTVLLVNNGNGAGRVGDIHGRFLTVRPEVGLLTSTARTFIQEGTTTEFATQVLGTTLENGRLYAQYLKKSSRVLYENANSNIHVAPSVVTSWVGDSTNLHTRAFLQSHNDLLNADAPDWQDIDDRLGGSSTSRSHDKFVGNTDFVSFQSASPTIGLEAASSTNSDHESPSKNVPIVNVFPDRFGNLENNARKLAAQKVLPIGDLPTFTIKTHFEPSAYQLDDDNSMSQEEQRQHASYLGLDDGRSPKVFYQHLMEGQNHDNVKMPAEQSLSKETVLPKRTLATVTYYGFADFTTLVGDSVIVFSPNTLETSPNFGHVTSIKGKATLSTLESRSGSNIAPQSSITIGMQKAEIVSTQINPWAIGLDVNTSEIPNNPPSAVQSMTPELKMSQGSIISTASGSSIGNIITTEQVAPKKTELSETNPTFSLPTDQEISEIYASLAKAQDKAATPSSISEASSEIVFDTKTLKAKSSVQVLGGATTVFIDDDPFANFVESIAPSTSTSSVLLSTSAPSTLINYESATEEAVTLGPEPLDISTLPPPGSTDEEETTIPSVTEDLTGIIDSQKLQETFGGKIENCKNTTSQVFLTQVPKSGVIEDLSTQFQNDASLLAAFDIVQTTKYYCIDTTVMHVEPQQVEKPENDIIMATSSLYIPITTDSTPSTEAQDVDETTTEDSSSLLETHTEPNLVEMPVKEGPTVPKLDEASSSENDSDERETEKDSEDYDADTESDEVDLIYKTLYTTYTYLTTFFQAESSTVSSHTEIVTNVITSTVGTSEDVDVKPTAIVAQIGDNEITATQTLQGDSSAKTSTITTKYTIPEELESLLHVDSQSANRNSNTETISHSEATVYLDDAKYTKTFFTTYTYYTTIFADSDTEIMSRTEVLTNYVTESAGKTSLSASILNSDLVDGQKVVPSPISTLATASSDELHNISKVDEERVTLVTDVRSSSSNGEQQVIGKGLRDPFDDQVSSESNTDEIIPSATLLLQTSFTTFTFYTTMYSGDITNVVSRLETVTNVATETLQPTKTLAGSVDEATLPITYFTTFTYWTKLAKDGEITTLSREETISNVIGPTQEASSSTYDYAPIMTITDSAENHFAITPETSGETNATVKSLPDLTTYYTTYTYYTTSYEANNTVTDSRFETVTNVVTPTSTVATSLPALDELDAKKDLSQTVTKIHGLGEINTPDLVLYDYKHIVDADGVSTLYFTTQIVSSVNIEGAAIAVTSSTSSLYIDEAKKLSISTLSASEATDENGSVSRQYKTGLVRLIEGTRIGNSTTTLYQSKVIGTLIDDRYAQIIESTSSFLFEKTVGPTEIVATPTLGPIISTQEFTDAASISESGDSTISDTETTTESNTDGNDDTEIQDTLQSKKRTFAPVIRPFASRNRPTFAPKQKIITPSSATIITRSDITPTITATPALKTIGRYSSSKRGPISNAPINPNDSSTSRRSFGRPIKPSSSSALSEVSNSSVFAPSRNRFASSSRSGPLLSSRRLGASASYRPSNGPGFRASALNTLNSKLRIKPTAALSSSLGQSTTNTVAPANPDSSSESEHSTETPQTTDEDETLLENSRRNQNPLLRFRRPLNRPSGFTPIPRPNAGTSNSPTISPRRNPLSGRAKTSATTTTTTTTTVKPRPRSFQRPTISSLQGRSRPQNNLFPPRGLFQAQQQKTEAPPEVKQAEAEAENDSEYDDDDDADDDGDEDGQDETNRRRRSNNKLARPKTHLRVRRQADGLNRSRFRFRRPSTASPPVADEQTIANTDDLSESTVNPRAKARFGSRYQAARGQGQSQHLHGQTTAPSPTTTTNLRSIRPTRPISSRTQFTLREKDNSSKGSIRPGSNFRRQQPSVSSSIRRKTGSSTVGSTSRRLKSYNSNSGNNNVESSGSRSAASRGRNGNTNASSRSRVRSRNRNEYISDQEPTELGTQTITVTHLIPAEVTVPVINGQVTEYKNIVTAKTSTEVLGPHQYSQIVGTNGQTSVFLTREDSSVNIAGATELTRYLLHDSLTTTITFTPTTIRGRKTSFSHVLPSTVYSVEALISTVQPQISANAPLANILLSQLLLGNLNLPSNPLIGALGQQLPDTMPAVSPTPLQPVTEFRTHTSTFVTTIFDGKSTIVPVTFQGKKILTTVYDSSWQTITATEYSVDTIVNTPTQQQPQHAQSIGQVAQVNSLLLQQLLLQQQQPQQPQLQTISHTTSPQIFLSDNLQDLDEASRSGVEIGGRDSIDDIIVPVENENDGEVQHKGDNNRSDKPLTTAVNSESINSRYIELTYAENPEKSFDEARYNLATHVMSNGVELIIASEKVKYMEKQSSTSHPFKFGNGHVISTVGLQSQQQKPLTLAPSTLKNQMFLALPSVKQKQKFTIPINDNQFITKTCLTTYTYHSTYLQNGTSIVVSKESVISNRHTEERNLFQASTILQTDVILSRTPELVVGVFPTTYHYFNTILDTDHEEEDVHNALPIVITSKYTILNTVTGPEDYISYLQPSELATPTQDTNTYFSRIAFTKTLQNELDSDTPKILITENILTQVIVTESLPSRGALARKSSSAMPYSHNDTDLQIYATKTVLTTLTFYKTNLDDLNTRTALATPPVLSSQTTRQPEHANDVNKLSAQFQTRVIENIVTNTVDSSLLRPELISRFRAELLQKKGKTHPNVIVTVATLLGGQTLRITAVNAPKDPLLKPTSITKSRKRTTTAEDIKSKPTIKPSKKNSIEPYQTNDQKSHTPIQTSSIKRTRVQENLVQTQVQSHSHPSSDGDQIVAESEDKDVYVRPSSELQPSTDSMAIPVQQFLGSFDLKRLRPMLNVMANLLQKNIVNRHRTQSLSVATLPKDSIDEAKNPSITANFDGPAPVYIPLKISENGPGHFTTTILPILDGNQHAHPLSNEDRLADTSDSANVKKLTAHSLHIHPPNLQFPQLTAEENLLQQNLKNVSHYRFPFSNTADPYHSSLLSKDIPIRPGEIITANADIIIGRPGGIKIRNQEPKKMLLHTHIPLLPPPPPTNTIALVAVSGSASVSANNRINNDIVLFNKGPVSEFDNILSPPPISNYNSISGESLKFKNVIRYPGNVLSPTPAAPPIQNFRPHHGNQVYSSPQIANLNSELNNNEILEIKQIPEIFSTKLPAITSYTTFRSSYYVSPLPQTRIYQMQPTSTHKMLPSASTFSTLLKKNVLSHTVKMQAPPLTFKKDSDNFPYSTAIRGRLAHIPMPLVKIPLHEENVDVRLTPQNNRLIFLDTSAQPASQSIISPSTLKQQKQNVLHEVDNSPQGLFAQQSQQQFSTSTFRPPDKKPHNTLPTLHNQAPNDFEIPDLEMLDAHHSVSKVATNSDNIYKNRHDQVQWKNVISAHKLHHDNNDLAAEQDQRVAYTILNTAILNSQKPEVPEFIENVSPTEPYPKKWISSIKIEDLHQGKPFVLRNQTVPKLVPNSGIHKIFIAKGEHFHPHTESTTRFNQPISNSRFTTYVPSSSIVSTESRVYNPHTNVIASSPTTPYSPPYTEENILNYSLHQKTSSADKFYELSLPVNNGYSSLATSTKINTRPLQTSIFLGHSPVPATKPIIESRPNAKLRLTPNLSSTLKNLYSLMPKPTTTQTYSTINVSRSKTSKINTESHNLKKLEPSEIFEQNSQLILKTKAELITPSFASASKEKNSIHRSTYSRISSSIKLNQHPSAIPVLSPNYISKSRFDNSFQSTDVQPHKTNQDLERYNEIPLESSEFVFSSSIRHDNTPLTNRTEIAKIEPTLNPGITHHDEDTGLIQTSIHPLKTSKVKASKTSNVSVKTIHTTHSKTVTKVEENSVSNQTYLSRFVPTITTTSVRLNSTGLPQKVVIKSIIKATVDVHYLKPNNPESNEKILDKKERKTTVATSKPSTLNVISVVENGADIGAVDNRKGNSGHKGDSDISYEYAARDEEILPPIDSNSVLLGGVLIDSPRNPHFKTTVDNKNVPTSNELLCSPACRSSKNEICITVTSKSHCECRPGFARMFPDRPCKPTYTYELNLQTNRVGTYQLQFSDTLKGNSSNEYRHLSSIILDAVDRMVMQSDFRDIYHGVQLKSIDTDNEVSKTIVGKFLLQLSESSDLKRLETVFKKYLRQSNYSIGGTELYTSKDGINSLAIADFDECVHDNFNDCSVNAHCFNLIGSYTCSCSDGFVDVSPNAIYPGRQCSDSIIGCDKCNYNGKCVAMSGEKRDLESAATICRCFPWHAGATCQLNLKILLICLIAIGTFLLVLLLFCILLLYMRRKSRGQQTTSPIFITASTLHPNMLTSSSNKSRLSTSLINQTSPDKHAILNDSNSESSHSSLSYLHREPVGKGKKEKSNPGSFPSTNIVHRSRASPFQNTRHEAGSEHYQPTQSAFNTVEMVGDSEQTDRSLTFMIPRAKYYHPFPFRNQSDFTTFTEKAKQLKISPTATSSVRGPSLNECTTLVSAGFEVSAIVSDQIVGSNPNTSVSELRSNGARSFDETTVRAVTKSMLLNFDMQTETHSHTNEEANTMAERDLGSTFLLPHTHLYKPERMESDISGFDSI